MGHNLTLNEQWQLVLGHQAAQSFAQVNFIYAQLPRAVMAIVVGAVLGWWQLDAAVDPKPTHLTADVGNLIRCLVGADYRQYLVQ